MRAEDRPEDAVAGALASGQLGGYAAARQVHQVLRGERPDHAVNEPGWAWLGS